MAIIRRPVASAILFLVEFTALTQRRRERGEPQSWFNRNHAVGFLTQRRKDAKAQRLKRKMSLGKPRHYSVSGVEPDRSDNSSRLCALASLR
jgi:hypothetical protein